MNAKNYLPNSYEGVELNNQTLYFPALTGLRALAAWLVFFYHAGDNIDAAGMVAPLKWIFMLVQQGDVGVSIFFMLSGFLITIRYQREVSLSASWFKRYFQNRFARIYPIYFLLTGFAFIMMIVRPSYNWYQWPVNYTIYDKLVAIVLNLTLTRAYFQDMTFLGVPTAWSLTVEESFYLLAPFLLLSLRQSMHRLWLYPLILFLIGILLVLFCSHFLPYYGLMGSINFMLIFTFFGRSLDFIIGMWLGLKLSTSSAREWLRGKSTWIGLTVLAAIMLIVSGFLREWKTGVLGRLIIDIAFAFPIALLLRGLITEHTWLHRLLKTKTFDLLGKSSYVFYLVHLGIIDTIFTRFITDNWISRFLLFNGFSIGVYLLIEHPVHNWLRAKKLV